MKRKRRTVSDQADNSSAAGMDNEGSPGYSPVNEEVGWYEGYRNEDSTVSNNYLKYLKKYPLLSKEQEYELSFKSQAGDLKSRDIMVKSNLGLVISVAKRFLGRGLSFDDLIMEGNIGLIKAVDRFKPKKGFRFSTYAIWWIRQSIERGILNSGRLIRIPIHISENLYKYARAAREVTEKMQREPRISEVANYMGIKEKKLEKILGFIGNIYSLDVPYSQGHDDDDQNMLLSNIVKDEESDSSPFDVLDKIETMELLNKWLLNLDNVERKVIMLRYGFNNEKPRTLNEIGMIFGLTKERIRQIEVKSIKKLRKMAEDAGLEA